MGEGDEERTNRTTQRTMKCARFDQTMFCSLCEKCSRTVGSAEHTVGRKALECLQGYSVQLPEQPWLQCSEARCVARTSKPPL
eukprot:6203437-Pleurochrysis_carterae.AAC.1